MGYFILTNKSTKSNNINYFNVTYCFGGVLMNLERKPLMKFYYSMKDYDQETELRFLINEYLLSLLGIACDAGSLEQIVINDEDNKQHSNIYFDTDKIIFKNSRNSTKGYYVSVSIEEEGEFKETYLSKIRLVYDELLKVTYNNFNTNDKILNKYSSFAKALSSYDYAVQRGICHWIADNCTEQIEHLLLSLEKWSSKTYEGKKVPFAFVVDLKSVDGSFNYMDFLNEEYSATFTDGITSIVELDNRLHFIKYLSLTKDNMIPTIDISSSPYRFAQVIMEFTKGKNKVGIILLTSGDIILIKDAKIELIKRDGNWINFNKDIFVSVVMTVNNNYPSKLIERDLLNAIFYTALDVSFSHGGGLIAIVNDKNKVTKPSEYDDILRYGTSDSTRNYGIINYIDDLQLVLPTYEDLARKYELFKDSNMKKRFYKRAAIVALAGQKYENSNQINFIKLDRKLRAEFVSMDGATILDKNGDVISFGAIIQNDSGSYGGGRGAAAKKLSNYGLAIKISTDGYIEVYIMGKIKYRMK